MKFFRIALVALPWLMWSSAAGADPISAIIVSIVGSVGVTVTASAVTGFLINTAISVGLSLVAQMLTPKPKMQDPTFGADVTTRDSIAPRRLIYGTTKVAGTMVYIKATDNNYKHHYVIVLGQGPIDGVTTVYFNDEALTLDASGNVTSGAWAGNARVKVFTGEPTQAASSDLIAESGGEWTSNHRLQGIAYIYVRLNWTSALAAAGLPNISAVVRGLKVFDPRTSTTDYSANAALCFRHYLTLPRDQGGAGYTSPLGIDDTGNIIPQANICDENVALSGGGTEKRYECHGYFELDDSNTPQERIQRFLTAMAGTMDPQAGQFRFYAGAWRGSVFSINESMMVGEFTVVRGESGARRYNAIKGAYLDPLARYVAADYPAVTSTVFEAQDGGEQVFGELSLPMTTSPAMAQRVAKIALYRQRLGMRAEAVVSLEAFGVAVGDIVSISFARYGFSAKQFEVTDREFKFQDAEIVIKLSLRETGSAVYDWSATEQQLVASSPPTTLPNWSLVAAPSIALAAGDAELLIGNDGSVISRMKVSITGDGNAFIDKWAVQWKKSADTTWNEPVVIQATGSSAAHWISPIDDGNLYDVRVRAGNVLGAVSPWATVNSFLALGKSAPPTDVTSIQLTNGLLSWSYPSPPADFAGFRVKYQFGSYPYWANAGLVTDGLVTTTSIDVSSYLSGPVTLMVKSVDTSGNEATNAAIIVTNLGDYITSNVVLTTNLKAAGFPGTINSGSVVGGNLVGSVLGYYWQTDDTAAFWQQSGVTFWTADVYGPVEWIATIVPEASYLDATLSLSSTIAGAPYAISYRTGGSALQWQGVDTGTYWTASDTATYWAAQGDWLPWPGSVGSLTRQAYDIRTTIVGGSVQPVISAFNAVFDVPDISEQIANAAILTGGSRLAVTKSYRAITNVNVTLQGSTGGAVSVSVEDKLATGPLVKVMNSSGASVAGTIDAIIQGY